MTPLRINLFTYGDARDVNTWSNLPYYFHRALVSLGVHVNPVDISPSNDALRVTRRLYGLRARAASAVGLKTSTDVFRSRAHHRLADRIVRHAVRQHPDADMNVFMTFSFSSYACSAVPVVHYCDRTYEQHLEDKGIVAARADRAFIQIERDNLAHAALVLTTSEVCRDFIKARYQAKRVAHLTAGINAEPSDVDADSLIARKENSRNVLFIGRGAHKRGVDILIDAFTAFNARHGGSYTLHVVGIRPDELPAGHRSMKDDIRFHGYLDRTVARDRELYNALIESARLFVFPTRPGPIAGVIREAQLNCTPVIISGVPGASERVAHDDNGIVVDSLAPEDFARHMDALVTDLSRWRRFALNAHLSVKNATWSATAQRFLQLAQASGLANATSAVSLIRCG